MTCYALQGVAAWVAREIQNYLKTVTYLLKSTEDLVCDLRDLEVPEGTGMMTIDIKDFYNSGELGDIIRDVAELWPVSQRRELLVRALWLLMGNQYVSSRLLPQALWI